jgi:hypothetical protein
VIEINRNPSRRDLVVFGVGLPILVGLLGAQRWAHGSHLAAHVIWAIGGVIALTFVAVPPLRRRIYVAWMYAVFPIGWVVSHVILAVVFYGVFAPTGVLLRLLGKDPMNRTFERGRASYWIPRGGAREQSSYFRQF